VVCRLSSNIIACTEAILMHMPDLGRVMLEGAIWDAVKALLGAVFMTAALQLIMTRALHVVRAKREIISLWIGGIVLFSAAIYFLGNRSQAPNFEGSIPQALIGPVPGSERDEVALITVDILNNGTMQSIVKNWRVQAEINGNVYDAMFVQMPVNFTFGNIPHTTLAQPTAITFHSEDNLAEKALKPIEIGGIATGNLFVEFSNVDQSLFRGKVTLKVSYEDALSRSYLVLVTTNGQIGQVSAIAGIHSELACPMPPGTITGSVPKPLPPLATPVPLPMH
jgi:hypothetical protein